MEDKSLNEVAEMPGYNRRRFLANAGRGVLAASFLTDFSGMSLSAQTGQLPDKKLLPAEMDPVKLPPLDDPSEKKEGDIPTPANPNKRVGFALVGLGHLTLNQILPAFGSSKY